MKILLTEGSGLTSRQASSQLAAAGHEVGVLSSESIGLTRFTRAVRRWHAAPPFGADPFTWLDAAIAVHRTNGYDLLLPTQEQVTVLAWAADAGRLDGVKTIVPPFAAVAAVQDKLAAHATLERLGLAQPEGTVLRSPDELAAWDCFPVFVKLPIGTASGGVRRLTSAAERDALVDVWAATGVFDDFGVGGLAGHQSIRRGADDDAVGLGPRRRWGAPAPKAPLPGAQPPRMGGVLAQRPADGKLVMAQAVFDQGHLVAFHANLRMIEGARGGASHKRSTSMPELRAMFEVLGADLQWHGALSADAIATTNGPLLIDINPRLVEPGNARRAGLDLVDTLVGVASDAFVEPRPEGRTDVTTHQLLLSVLGAAQHGAGRRGILAELAAAARHAGPYAGSTEELTPVRGDWRAGLPVAAATVTTLASPGAWEWFSSGSVSSYAISPEGWRAILGRRDEARVSCTRW